MLSEGDTYRGAVPIKASFDTLPHTSIMTDVVVVLLALAALTLFVISAWVAVIIFRKARRGQDVVPPSYPFGGNLFGGGSDSSRGFDSGGSDADSSGGGT
jgi:hypothetical protein